MRWEEQRNKDVVRFDEGTDWWLVREVHIRYGMENKGVMGHDPTKLVVYLLSACKKEKSGRRKKGLRLVGWLLRSVRSRNLMNSVVWFEYFSLCVGNAACIKHSYVLYPSAV